MTTNQTRDPGIPKFATNKCNLLGVLRARVQFRRDCGESMAALSERAGIPLGTLRKWVYRATTGDAASLERAIDRLGGASIEIAPGQ